MGLRATGMAENRKRKSTELHGSQKKARPTSVSAWRPAHVADYLRACDPKALAHVADAIEQEGISGRTAMKLTEDDLVGMTKSPGERKSALQALKDLKHPLMPAFIQMDTDQSNTISAPELAHVLTRVKGRCVTEQEASRMIETADVDQSGDVDFREFKDILEADGASDWGAAAEAVGAPRALLNAGLAFRNQSDDMLFRTHSALRSGAGRFTGRSALSGFLLPTPVMRFFVVEGFALFLVGLFLTFTLGIGGFYALFCLYPRGQFIADWICGTQYRDVNTGRPLSFCQMFLLSFVGGVLNSVLISIGAATLIPFPLIWWLVELCVASNDPHNRTTLDKMMGCAVVYRPIVHEKFA